MTYPIVHVSDALVELGWDAAWAAAFAPHTADGLVPARVTIEYNHLYRGTTADGDVQLQHAGRFKHRALDRSELAAVGDWVAVRLTPGEAAGTIEAVLPRRSHFSRKVAGELTEEQVVAANIDTVFLVMGLDGDYNPRRLERYLLLAYESGATPVVLLSKADLAVDLPSARSEIAAIAGTAPVLTISVITGEGLAAVRSHMAVGRTGALLGSSGAGKSTLINALMGEDRLRTQTVRASDSRGRHTTRHRQLIVLPDAGLLIDTPGMRELQLWDVTQATRDAFEDVEALTGECHFTDCRHRDEPRCAVKAAVADGRLDAVRLSNYLKLQDELVTLDARKDARAVIDEKRRSKVMGKAIKQFQKQRGR
jgi:ribosome biogenesis GTPase / thiamine phosphate phosphatase